MAYTQQMYDSGSVLGCSICHFARTLSTSAGISETLDFADDY